jgi:ABC-type antimicrobial peptide transport system permease subunit
MRCWRTRRRDLVDQDRRAAMTESLWQRRLWGVLFAALAGLALLLAAVGVYGVVSYSVAQRTREMGVRLALGAAPAAARRLVVRESMTLCAIGVVIGTLCALALGRVAQSVLFGVTPYDPVTYSVVLAVMVGTVAVACWLPAVRAAGVNPIVALRIDGQC